MTPTIDPTVRALFTAVETDLANFRAELIKLDKHWASVCRLGTRDDSVAFHVAVGEWNKIDTAGLQSRLNGYWTSEPAGRAWAKYAEKDDITTRHLVQWSDEEWKHLVKWCEKDCVMWKKMEFKRQCGF